MSVRRWVWPSWRPMSMPACSMRLMVCEGGMEVTRILMRVLLELGTDSYTEVVPAPQVGLLW
jgi:hypothetical protein